MIKQSLMDKLISWARFKVNLGKGTPVRDLPSTFSNLSGKQDVPSFEKLKEILSKDKK